MATTERPTQFYVISHTHWDREWYMPLELMRLRLTDLIDHCLTILAEQPTYRFHLDAQTVVLEDYLQIRPENAELLHRYIQEGRLLVGPWYLQNDFYLTSGEATVRNLLVGRDVATSFGRCDTVGYAPDQFGNISQLPQILRGFGIDNFIFGRGVARVEPDENGNLHEVPHPAEFVWEGADGSRLLAIHMGLWYNNAQRFSQDLTLAAQLAERSEKHQAAITATPYYLLMNGVDHLEAQEDLLPILERLNAHWKGQKVIGQHTLGEYVEQIRHYVAEHHVSLPTHQGELRSGHDWSLLKGCLSSRSYLKTANVRAQDMLEVRMEPLYSMLEMAGATGICSRDHLRYFWKKLLRNHPHDSICGCSRDEIHHRMEESYASLALSTNEWLSRGLQVAAGHAALDERHPDEAVVVVVNTTQTTRSGLVESTVEFTERDAITGFRLIAPDGEAVPFTLLEEEAFEKDIFSPINLPGRLAAHRYRIRFFERGVAPFAFKGYRVSRAESLPAVSSDAPITAEDGFITLENTHLRVQIDADGHVCVCRKADGACFPDALDLEDTADRGDAYVYGPGGDEPLFGNHFPVQLHAYRSADGISCCDMHRTLVLPERYLFDRLCRSERTVACPVTLTLTLEPDSPALRVSYRIENHACDHRLRLLVRTGLAVDASIADMPFDVVSRDDSAHYYKTMSRVMPNTSFALVETADGGMAVLTEGQHEYEQLAEKGTLAFTLLRSTGVISRDFEHPEQEISAQWRCPGNQCLRVLEGQVGLYPYTGTWVQAAVPITARQFRNPLLTAFAPLDPHKFAGGRPAVQDSGLDELFYRDDPYAAVTLPDNRSLIALEGSGILVTALKPAHSSSAMLLRAVNLTDDTRTALLCPLAGWQLREAALDETAGKVLGSDQQQVVFTAKQIRTFLLEPCNER